MKNGTKPQSSAHTIKIESENCIEDANLDELEAADLAAGDDTEDDTATAPDDDEAADLSEVHLGAEGSAT